MSSTSIAHESHDSGIRRYASPVPEAYGGLSLSLRGPHRHDDGLDDERCDDEINDRQYRDDETHGTPESDHVPRIETALDELVVEDERVSHQRRTDSSRDTVLAELAASVAPRGFRIARDLLGSREQAEDVVQEALARACEQRGRLRDPGAIKAWYYRVLTNLCMRSLRRRRLRRLFLGKQRAVEPIGGATSRQPGADSKLAVQQDITQVLRALDVLPAKQRAALLLRYGHELSVAEIADMLDVRPATVKTHLVRGLRRLRKTMEST